MKKLFAIVALVAAMLVVGKAQAQTSINVGYAPETFTSGNTSTNYQGFFLGFTQNIDLSKGLAVATGAQFRMNTRSISELNGSLKTKETQTMIDVPVLVNYPIAINRDLSVVPFVGPMLTLALTGNTNTQTFLGNTQLTNTDYNWYGDNSSMNRFNLSAVFGADVKFSNFNLYGAFCGATDSHVLRLIVDAASRAEGRGGHSLLLATASAIGDGKSFNASVTASASNGEGD